VKSRNGVEGLKDLAYTVLSVDSSVQELPPFAGAPYSL
jgi:hypothetical protein